MTRLVEVKVPKTEDDHQALVMMWANAATPQYPALRWLFHIPNERKCTPQQGARLRRIGVRRGVADLFLPCPMGHYAGLWIEMKTPDGRASEDQKAFILAMRQAGYAARVCYGYTEAIQTLEQYLKGADLDGLVDDRTTRHAPRRTPRRT